MANKVTATILFVDIMDSMELANYWDTTKYSELLNEFQRLMQHSIGMWERGIKQIKFAGDELVVFYCSKSIDQDILNAIRLANTLKIMWYASKPNRKRIKEGKKILDLGVGINTGYVTYEYRPVVNILEKPIPRRKTFEGLPISLAKRIESFSRQGRYSRIMIGHRTMAELNKCYHEYECEPMGLQRFKGMSQEVPVFELKSCYTLEAEVFGDTRDFDREIRQLEHIMIFDPSNIWLLMTLIDIFSHKNDHKKVEKLCRKALAADDSVSNIHYQLGISFLKQKRYEEALAQFDKTINLRWDSWRSYVEKTVCLIFLGRYEDCIETCKYAISNIPAWLTKSFSDDLYYNMAAANARSGNERKALTSIKKAIKLGGGRVVNALKKDEDGDFCNLYENAEFIKIRKGKLKAKCKKHKK